MAARCVRPTTDPARGAGCYVRNVKYHRVLLASVAATVTVLSTLVPTGSGARVYSCGGLITAKTISALTGRSVVAQTSGRPWSLVNCYFKTDARHLGSSYDLAISVGDPLEPISTVKANAVAPSTNFSTGVATWHFGAVSGLGKAAMVGGFNPSVAIVVIVGPKNVLRVNFTAMTYKHVKPLSQAEVLAIARAVYAKLV